jgi:hypothetical protein
LTSQSTAIHQGQQSIISSLFLKRFSHFFQVKKTTEAFNNYFNSNGAADGGGGGGGGAGRRWDNADDFSKMPPPKFAPIKKRKSKRPLDYSSSSNSLSSSRSAPTTPTTHSPLKEVNAPPRLLIRHFFRNPDTH